MLLRKWRPEYLHMRSDKPFVSPRAFLWPDLSHRLVAEELMDNPDSDPVRLERTLRQFVILNRLLSRAGALVKRVFIDDMLRDPNRTYTVFDLGAGGGDFGRRLSRWCRRHGLRVRIVCIDHDPRVAAFAREHCRGWSDIEIAETDVRDMLAGGGRADYIYANHFLHHVDDHAIPDLLRAIDRAAGRAFLLNDIARTHWGYLGFTALCAAFFHRSFAFHDGRLSIRRAFTADELRGYVDRAGLGKVVGVGRCFPSRVFVWRSGLVLRSVSRSPVAVRGAAVAGRYACNG